MPQKRCRILFVTSFDVRLIDSVKTDGSMLRLLKDFLLRYEDLCDLFLFTGDTSKFDLAPAIETRSVGLVREIWSLALFICRLKHIQNR